MHLVSIIAALGVVASGCSAPASRSSAKAATSDSAFRAVPGTDIMAARRSLIRYVADTLPRGGEVRIITTDSLAIAAVHEFLAFQRSDHHAGMHEHPGTG